MEKNQKSSFDKLVAGLNAEDRLAMLNRINQTTSSAVQTIEEETDIPDKNVTLSAKLETESLLYRIFLYIRSLFKQSSKEDIYNDDLMASLARKINKNHPGVVNHKIKSLDYLFYERLLALKEASDFFKPYFLFINENPGDFYVFMSSFVAPQLAEQVNAEADPYILPFTKEVGPDVRTDLARKLDKILNNMDSLSKKSIYSSVISVNWLQNFVSLPFIHFVAQFTNIAGSVYTCPYINATTDFNQFVKVFSNIVPVQNEILESVYLFSQKKNFNENVQDKDIEKALREFLTKAKSYISTIQEFYAGVSIHKLSKVVNNDYDYQAEPMTGAENWFSLFRNQWRKILDIRWNEWMREQKKQTLSENLRIDFNLTEFPVMQYRPWLALWNPVSFSCELTGGFLSWFATEKYDEISLPLNEVMMEGIFIRSENRTEYSEGLNTFSNANANMRSLLLKLSPNGEYGHVFAEFAENKVTTLQIQSQINAMMVDIESSIKDTIKLFGKGARTIERIFHGFFDESKDGIHETLQNMSTIKGHDNHAFRDRLKEIRDLLRKSMFYIAELEPIDMATE
ncbi:MAG: DUF5312 domain-containing protein [Treponema sp.]|nr:DUF5312 domain-containing protein [Treponema sp.]